MTGQSEVVAFLSSPAAFDGQGDVDVIETHDAYVFLCGDTALKLKRAVKYDYLDLSTVELRHAMVEREIELNAPFAPMIYRDVLPVTRANGGLMLGGSGAVVDWVLRMWRFPAENELERVAARGDLDDTLATTLGEVVHAYHARAPVIERSGSALIADILDELQRVFAEFPDAAGTTQVPEWIMAAREALTRHADLLDRRGRSGHVRRAHGDLHLRNIVLLDGQPTLFDALEFDETLGTCDVLYDVAFLIMDLCQRDLRQQACRVLDAWLREARGAEDAGLAALPLFLSVRAAIRAMVLLQTDAAREQPGASADRVAGFLRFACDALDLAPPVLIAVGGYSASGKSLLAARLAPDFDPRPGAVLLASDLERKAGQRRDRSLGAEAYTPEQRAVVYGKMFDRAATILAAGHSVLLDATFLDPDLRGAAERVAAQANTQFHGIWLEAPMHVLEERLASRPKGASDATKDVLARQLAAPLGRMNWHRVEASGEPDRIYQAVLAFLTATQTITEEGVS